jgi:uncharacterized protein (TIGR00369 family)
MKTLSAHLMRVSLGAVEVELPLSPAVSQQAGIAHGGALVAIADCATGLAALSLMPPGADTATIELKINYLAPAVGDRMIARGRVVKASRRTTVTQAEVFAETAGREKLVGLVTAMAQGDGLTEAVSASGQKRTCAVRQPMSALPPKADMCSATQHVCFVPILLQKSAMTGAWRLARTYSSSCLPSAP